MPTPLMSQPAEGTAIRPTCETNPAILAVRIGPLEISPPLFQAPMAGYSNYAFRQLLRRLGGVGLLCTEMVSARGFLELDRRYGKLPERLWGVREEPRPVAVQIWDNDPDKLAQVAERLVEDFHVSALDINFGCPAEQITKGVACGAYLLKDPELVGKIVSRVVRTVSPVPVTAKMRLGYTDHQLTACEVARVVEQAGGSAVFVHGRTAQQKYRGTANWERIAEVKAAVQRIPVIGNGDIRSAVDAVNNLQRYRLDGVMIGRAALSRPWIFREASALLAGKTPPPEPTPEEQFDLIREQYEVLIGQFGIPKATILMKQFLCRFIAFRPGSKHLRVNILHLSEPHEILEAVRRFLLATKSPINVSHSFASTRPD
ncbi:tRNA dihydrouridine synthase B [Thermogutta terrifontis]|uniref:tRNA-dihydrouridine synthase n=1 Tax=Thermogutta terrifontis TaxID=1331910 RepID=A0A286RK35_9BACT|nr:tRNA-dihydrouridine synthase [Thermogutta terrifontis]ASV76316.1 tRNA dihydrouridine synthase B [Thermogutta terrifontis]